MIFSIVLLVLVGAVAFFHYTQGFFTATISAIIAVISAALALAYHETVVELLLGGRWSNTAHALALAVTFAAIYGVLRLLFDKMVPGNVRFPPIIDKVGAGAMGLVAGIFAGGIVAIVAQYMPLMPSVAGYARYAVQDREVTIPPLAEGGRALDSKTFDELKSDKISELDPADKQGLLIPVDDIVVNTTYHLSDGGSLAGKVPMSEVHPAFLDEIFSQRLGIQTGGSRVATKDSVRLDGLFSVPALNTRDHDYTKIRVKPLPTGPVKFNPNSQILLVVRLTFTRNAGDTDNVVRFSPASVRLVANKGTGASAQRVNYHPIGTVENAQVVYLNRLDDFLFVRGADNGADLAFVVDKAGFVEGGGQGQAMKVAEGVFIEFKRMARIDLSGNDIKTGYKASEQVKVQRKKPAEGDTGGPTPPTAAPTAAAPSGTPASPGTPLGELKQKLLGSWASNSDAGQLIMEFLEDGTLKYNNTPKTGLPQIGQGTWEVLKEEGKTLTIRRTINNAPAEATIVFDDDTNITLTSATTGRPIKLVKR